MEVPRSSPCGFVTGIFNFLFIVPMYFKGISTKRTVGYVNYGDKPQMVKTNSKIISNLIGIKISLIIFLVCERDL